MQACLRTTIGLLPEMTCDSCQTAQGDVVASLQRIRCICTQCGETVRTEILDDARSLAQLDDHPSERRDRNR